MFLNPFGIVRRGFGFISTVNITFLFLASTGNSHQIKVRDEVCVCVFNFLEAFAV